MQFKDLTAQDKSYIKLIHGDSDMSWHSRMKILTERYGVAERCVRKWISRLGFSEYREVENEEIRQGKLRKYDLSKRYYLLTWAQNATPVHKPFWDNLLTYAKFLDAEVGVIMGRYQNPTSQYSEHAKSLEYWDEIFSKKDKDGRILFSYLDGSRTQLHKNLEILADVKTVPTASRPLRQTEGISGSKSSIIGHPRVHLKSLAVLEGHHKKLLLTTGACTVKNYTDSRAGIIGAFHHTLGAVIVEIKDDNTFYIRQITANPDGAFTDLIYNVDGKVTKISSSAAFVMGDIHEANVEEPIVKETLRYFKKVRPEKLVVHDVFDGESVNHHEAKDPIKAYQKLKEGKNLVKTEVDNLIKFIDKYKLTDYGLHIVRSNHDVFLDRWIVDTDWKKDVANSVEYMEYSLALLRGEAKKGIIPYVLEKHYKHDITCLDLDDSLFVNEWELGNHGHLGNNGARGNVESFSKLNTKIVTAHTHTSERCDGAASVATYSKLRMGYNRGASSHGHSGFVIHNDTKGQHLIFMEDGKCSTLF